MKFSEFYALVNTKSVCYHTKYVKQDYTIPWALKRNLPNLTKFKVLLHRLTENKFYIWCTKDFSQETLYYDYILPTAVFLHYMHIDMDKLTEINLYIVNEKLYNKYNSKVGGEYTGGVNPTTNVRTHLILIKQFNPFIGQTKYNLKTKNTTLNSLFHELMHLVDRLTDMFDYDVQYGFRWQEIKAKCLATVFFQFYKGLLVTYDQNSQLKNTIWVSRHLLNNRIIDINTELSGNNFIINKRESFNECINNTDLIQQNIHLYKSLRQINTLKNFLTNFKERL